MVGADMITHTQRKKREKQNHSVAIVIFIQSVVLSQTLNLRVGD